MTADNPTYVKPRLLDLFCGAGGAAVGYHRAGFDIIGVDIKPQPHYPFEFWQCDVFGDLHLPVLVQRFDAIHASPPCQAFTQMSARWRGKGTKADEHPDLLTGTLELLRGTGLPWVVENVPGARSLMPDAITLHGGMFGLGVHRPRLFASNRLLLIPKNAQTEHPVGVYGKPDGRTVWRYRNNGNYKGKSLIRAWKSLEEGSEAMGIDWMDVDELREAIPPAYTEYIGRQLLEAVLARVNADIAAYVKPTCAPVESMCKLLAHPCTRTGAHNMPTTTTNKPTRYEIAKLLANSVQDFPDLEPEMLASIGAAIGRRGPLMVPVVISSDPEPILIDGHQRLRAMQCQDPPRTWIAASDVRVADVTGVARSRLLGAKLNLMRRHTSVEEKATLARRFQKELGLTQGQIAAEVFGVSRQAVNQWLKATEPEVPDGDDNESDDVMPALVVRSDGREYPAQIAQPKKEPMNPWKPPTGFAFKALGKVKRDLDHERPVATEGMSMLEASALMQLATDVIVGLEELCGALAAKGHHPRHVDFSDDELAP